MNKENRSLDLARVQGFMKEDNFIISYHARVRMFERNISTIEIKEIELGDEIIEDYAKDEPCPSALILGRLSGKYFHLVVAECDDHVRIFTVYKPEKDQCRSLHNDLFFLTFSFYLAFNLTSNVYMAS